MNVFFDVDATLIADDKSLRPHVHNVFEKLIEDGHDIYIWSGVGLRWDIIKRHNLQDLIKNCFVKPLWAHHERLSSLGVEPKPDFCVDDHMEIIMAFGGVTVMPYYYPNQRDQEMLRVYDAIRKASGVSAEGISENKSLPNS